MNVLVWNSWVTPAGGMERVALSLANGLAEHTGGRVLLVGPYNDVPILRERISQRVEFVPCPFARRPDALMRNWWQLQRLVKQCRIDVVSAHGSLLPLLPINVPVVWTEHGPRYGDRPILQGARAVAWRAIRQRLLNGAWKLVGCSEYVRRHVCTQLNVPASRAAVILNGVPNPERLTAVAPPPFASPYRIGFLGRLEPEKNPLDVFTLDRELAARNLACEWHVFGDGSLAAEMRSQAAASQRVRVHGLAANPADAFARMDALVFLSHGQMEGLPTVILEARLARRPVIAWNVTANPEAAGPYDELVPPFDLKLFADAVERVVRRGEAPPAAGTEFGFERMIARYAEVLGAQARGAVAA